MLANDANPTPPAAVGIPFVELLADQTPDSVGSGGAARPKPPRASRKDRKVSLDAPEAWGDKPVLKGQYLKPNMIRVKANEVRIFDLNEPEQLVNYNLLLKKTSNPDTTNELIVDQDRRFSEKTDNWKVLVTVSILEFLQIVEPTYKPKADAN